MTMTVKTNEEATQELANWTDWGRPTALATREVDPYASFYRDHTKDDIRQYCGHCGHEIFQREDGTWGLVIVKYERTELCFGNDPDSSPHEPGA